MSKLEDCYFVGYAALLEKFALKTPPPRFVAVIGPKHKRYTVDNYQVFTPRHAPEDSLIGHLTFALKYEGIDLAILKSLFLTLSKDTIQTILSKEINGIYSRKIWFLYEWLMNDLLDLPDLKQGNFVDLIDSTLQYPGRPISSRRHRIRNNLPGVVDFCPLIRKTSKLDYYIGLKLRTLIRKNIGEVHPDVLMRAAAFLLLQDSKASYAIEGETPHHSRAERWASIIGKAGQNSLSKQWFEELQREVITDCRFLNMGYRTEGGFIGTHDRSTGLPIPEHISSKGEDVERLMQGIIDTAKSLKAADFPAVLSAALVGFGFVFIHPFEDGNGRLHRYLIHHILSDMEYTPKGIVFPVSSVILERIVDYRRVLQNYSKPRLPFIEWQATDKGNVKVKNETIDFYRYFDATECAEFLFECVYETIINVLPNEVDYLQKYDRMKLFISSYLDMPDRLVDLLINFLAQNKGTLSSRARKQEFETLRDDEISLIESKYSEIFDKN